MLSEQEECLAKEIVDCAFKVHKQLGRGLFERVYEGCFCHELSKNGLDSRGNLIFLSPMIILFSMKDKD